MPISVQLYGTETFIMCVCIVCAMHGSYIRQHCSAANIGSYTSFLAI